MKIYRVSYRDSYDEHQGYDYFTNKSDASKAANKNEKENRDEIEEMDIKLNKNGVINLLSQWASHPDNG